MKIMFIGDCHGLKNDLEALLQKTPSYVDKVVQLGDLGVGFGQSEYWHDSLDRSLLSVNGGFIRGNHDNLSTCVTMDSWIEDGTIEDNIMYIGGAWSIDASYRTPGLDWWPDEEVALVDLQSMADNYIRSKPAIMVTHDAPLTAIYSLFPNKRVPFPIDRTKYALDIMLSNYKPKVWIFGHWHEFRDKTIEGTRFICLPELTACILDTESLTCEFLV